MQAQNQIIPDLRYQRIAKKVGNWSILLYKFLTGALQGGSSFSEDIHSSEARVDFCAYKDSARLGFANVISKGHFGTVGKLLLCKEPLTSEKESRYTCYEDEQLSISFDQNGNFAVFVQPVVLKDSRITPTDRLDTFTIAGHIGEYPMQVPFPQGLGTHYSVPERSVEMYITPIANVVYDLGFNPHIVKTFGIYPCDDTISLVMESVPGKTLHDFLNSDGGKKMSADLFDSLFAQAIMGSFSLYHHAGILHMDGHPGNYLLRNFAAESPDTEYYAHQDLFQKRYLHYRGLDPNVFGATELVINTHDVLMKASDYGMAALDLRKAQIEPLRMPVLLSNLGEVTRPGIPDITIPELHLMHIQAGLVEPRDYINNTILAYFQNNDSSGPLFIFMNAMRSLLKGNAKARFGECLDYILDDQTKAYFNQRSVWSRFGPGPYEEWIARLSQVLFKFQERNENGRSVNVAYCGFSAPPTPEQLRQHSLVIDWSTPARDPILKSLISLRECVPNGCSEEDRSKMIRSSPSGSIRDTFSLRNSTRISGNRHFYFDRLREYPVESKKQYRYLEQTRNPSNRRWSSSVVGQYIRGLYAMVVTIRGSPMQLDFRLGMDLLDAVHTVPGNALAINGNYFVVNANLNNGLQNYPPGTQLYHPLGVSYVNGEQFVVPFPPIYDSVLRYICVREDGRHDFFTTDEMLAFCEQQVYHFKYSLPASETKDNGQLTFIRRIRVPQLERFALENGYQCIYQTGPVITGPVTENNFFQLSMLDEEFRITREDIDACEVVIGSPGTHINPEHLFDCRYCVTTDRRGVPDGSFHLYQIKEGRGRTLYGMNHSNLFVEQNILLIYEDYIRFLLIGGRGYGSEGIDRSQLAQWIRQHTELGSGLRLAISLDGGFSSNALVKNFDQRGDASYTYALEDPERRSLGISYLYTWSE